MGLEDINRQQQEMTADQKKMFRQQSKTAIQNLNLTWLHEMVNSPQQLREKMSLFWHGHFATRSLNIFFQQQLLDIIRKEALGNFGDLLRAVSKSGSMINFLSNNLNKKNQPNENFAREVMELFTLGRDQYTETDIKEAARAFTGWGANAQGEFVFRSNVHDGGTKIIFGKTGNFEGDDVIDMLLEKKQTALFITQKIYKFFVNDTIDTEKVQWLANRFYQNKYELLPLLTDIFTSDWFYESKNMGNRIKSPVELLTGIQRLLPMEIQNEEVLLLLQRLLGQLLFYPPNVAGWAGGKNWIDSSTLMMRLRIPQLLYSNNALQLQPKDDDDVMMGLTNMEESKTATRKNKTIRKGEQRIMAAIHWDVFTDYFKQTNKEALPEAIRQWVLPFNLKINAEVLQKYSDNKDRENYIKTITIQLMSTPEYQLC
jgi:uncharacterized protein (DUF1800 family)